MSVEKVLGAFMAGPAEGHDAEALADLILAALQQSRGSQHSLSTVTAALLKPESMAQAREHLPNGHSNHADSSAGKQQDSHQSSTVPEQSSTEALGPESASLAVLGDAGSKQPAAQADEATVKGPPGEAGSDTQRNASPAKHAGSPEDAISAKEEEDLAPTFLIADIATVHAAELPPPESRLTHLCTLLSRLGAQREQPRNDEKLWQSEAWGADAKHLAQPDVLISHPHAAKVCAIHFV